jgi:hypothetical protein
MTNWVYSKCVALRFSCWVSKTRQDFPKL